MRRPHQITGKHYNIIGLPHHWKPPKHGQIAFPPTCWPDFQTQPCTTFINVVNSQAVPENARWGRGVRTIGHPGTFCTPVAGKWYVRKFAPILPLYRTLHALAQWFEAAKSGLGEGSGRRVPWVTLSRPDVGANTGDAIPPQPVHAFQPDQS